MVVKMRYPKGAWPFSDTVELFHRHEGYPSLASIRDLYITSEQGLRFKIWENFIATMQLDYRWDNTPSPGFERSDTQYLATLGYAFDRSDIRRCLLRVAERRKG